MLRLKHALMFAIAFCASPPCGALPDFDFQVPQTRAASPKTSPIDLVVDLDMSCPRECVPAELAFEAEKFSKPTVSISEGENLRSVSKNCMLTASEYFATRQAMHDEQKIGLNENGTACSGAVNLDKYTVDHCRNLYVPRCMVAIQDASKVPKIELAGELHVAGLYDVQGAATNCAIKAKRIKLYPGGWIGSASPSVKGMSFTAERIETLVASNREPGPAANFVRDEIYLKDKGRKKNIEQINSSLYEVRNGETILIKANDEFIPTEGVDFAVEVGLYRQQRESCQPKTAE